MSELVEFDLVLHSEIEICRPPAVIWPHLDRLQEWKDSVVSVERTAGARDTVGEVLRIGQQPAGQTVHVLQRTLRIQVPHHRVQSLTTEDGISTTGYVIYSLMPRGDQTLVVCDVLARVRVPAAAHEAGGAAEFARGANDATQAKLDGDHRALKRLVERQ